MNISLVFGISIPMIIIVAVAISPIVPYLIPFFSVFFEIPISLSCIPFIFAIASSIATPVGTVIMYDDSAVKCAVMFIVASIVMHIIRFIVVVSVGCLLL